MLAVELDEETQVATYSVQCKTGPRASQLTTTVVRHEQLAPFIARRGLGRGAKAAAAAAAAASAAVAARGAHFRVGDLVSVSDVHFDNIDPFLVLALNANANSIPRNGQRQPLWPDWASEGSDGTKRGHAVPLRPAYSILSSSTKWDKLHPVWAGETLRMRVPPRCGAGGVLASVFDNSSADGGDTTETGAMCAAPVLRRVLAGVAGEPSGLLGTVDVWPLMRKRRGGDESAPLCRPTVGVDMTYALDRVRIVERQMKDRIVTAAEGRHIVMQTNPRCGGGLLESDNATGSHLRVTATKVWVKQDATEATETKLDHERFSARHLFCRIRRTNEGAERPQRRRGRKDAAAATSPSPSHTVSEVEIPLVEWERHPIGAPVFAVDLCCHQDIGLKLASDAAEDKVVGTLEIERLSSVGDASAGDQVVAHAARTHHRGSFVVHFKTKSKHWFARDKSQPVEWTMFVELHYNFRAFPRWCKLVIPRSIRSPDAQGAARDPTQSSFEVKMSVDFKLLPVRRRSTLSPPVPAARGACAHSLPIAPLPCLRRSRRTLTCLPFCGLSVLLSPRPSPQANEAIASELNEVTEVLLSKALDSLEREKLDFPALASWGIDFCAWLDFGWRRTIAGSYAFEAAVGSSAEGRVFVCSFDARGFFTEALSAECRAAGRHASGSWPDYDYGALSAAAADGAGESVCYPRWDALDRDFPGEEVPVLAMVEAGWEDGLVRAEQREAAVQRGGRGYWTLQFLKSVLHYAGCELADSPYKGSGLFAPTVEPTTLRISLQPRTRARFIVLAFGQLVCDRIRHHVRRLPLPSASTARYLVAFLHHVYSIFEEQLVACYSYAYEAKGKETHAARAGEPLFDFVARDAAWAELFDDAAAGAMAPPAQRRGVDRATTGARLARFVEGALVYTQAKTLGSGAQRVMAAQLKQRFETVRAECAANLDALHDACDALTALLVAWTLDTPTLMETYLDAEVSLISLDAARHPERQAYQSKNLPHWNEVVRARAASGLIDVMWPPAPTSAPRICKRSPVADCYCATCARTRFIPHTCWLHIHEHFDDPLRGTDEASVYEQSAEGTHAAA